jgi:hypothetical protein
MEREKHIIVLPGLGDHTTLLELPTRTWRKRYNTTPHIYHVGWNDTSTDYKTKLKKIADKATLLAENKSILLSIIGCSAGSSLAVNLSQYLEQRGIEVEGGIFANCGRLFKGSETGIRTLEFAAKNSPAFFESVITCGEHLQKMTAAQRKQIMTFHPWRGMDEIVPVETTLVEGATNIEVSCIGHAFTICAVMMRYADLMFEHIEKLEKARLKSER